MTNALFRLLIRAYPTGFRVRFGDEMIQVLQESYQETTAKQSFRETALFWMRTLLDWARSVSNEQVEAGSWKGACGFLAALGVGLGIGYLDFNATEVQGTVLVIVAVSALFAAIWPRHAWRWALAVGGGVPIWYLSSTALHHFPIHPVQPNGLATLIALIPGVIGAYSGAAIRVAAGR